MPYMRVVGEVLDHWLRSPLNNVNAVCTDHKQDEQELKDRILLIQNNTASLLRSTETAFGDAMAAIVAAMAAGSTDDQLTERAISIVRPPMRDHFVMSENSTGFHSPQEAARNLANAIRLRPPGAVERGTHSPEVSADDGRWTSDRRQTEGG